MKSAETSLSSLGKTVGSLKQTLLGLGAAGLAREVLQQVDSYAQLSARLSIVTTSSEDLARVQNKLFVIAQETRQQLDTTGDLYFKLASSTKDLGLSQAQLLSTTTTLTKALVVSGASGRTADAAMQQLAQGLGSGALRGQEFTSVSEQANRVTRALADGLGKTIGELRKMADEGKLTTDVIISALASQSGVIDKEFAKMPKTIGQAIIQAQNALTQFIGQTSATSGSTAVLTGAIDVLTKNISTLAAVAIGFGTIKLAETFFNIALKAQDSVSAVIAQASATNASRTAALAATQAEVTRLVATEAAIVAARTQALTELAAAHAFDAKNKTMLATAAVTTTLATLGRQQAAVTAELTAAQVALNVAQTSTVTTSSLLSRGIGLLGGPVGAIATALGLAVTAWQLFGNSAKDEAAKAANATEQSTASIIADIDAQIVKLKQRNALAGAGQSGIAKAGGPNADRAAALLAQITATQGKISANPEGTRADQVFLIDLKGQYDDLIGSIKTLGVEQAKIDDFGRTTKAGEWAKKYANDLEQMNAEIKKAKEELGDKFTADLEKRIRDKFTKKGAKGAVDDPTKKQLDGQIKSLEASVAHERDILAARTAFLDDAYSHGYLSVSAYFDQVQAAREEEVKSITAFYDQEESAARAHQATVKTLTDFEADQNKIQDIQEKSANFTRDAQRAEEELSRERKQAAEEYASQLDELNAKVLDLNGNTAAASSIRFTEQNKVLKRKLTASHDIGGLADLAFIEDQTKAQAELNEETRKYAEIIDKNTDTLARISLARSTSAISETEYLNQISAANRALIPVLNEEIDAYAKIAEGLSGPEGLAAIQALRTMRLKVDELTTQTDLLGKKFNEIFETAFAQGLEDAISGTKSLKEAFLDMSKSIATAIDKIAAEDLAARLFGGKGANGAGGIGGFFSQLFGGGGSSGPEQLSGPGMGQAAGGFAAWLGSLFEFAGGGTPPVGRPSLVGERGPELFVPKVAGTIVPNNKLGGSSTNVFNITVPSGTSRASADQIARATGDAVQRAQRRNG